jgi:hypothetical protein
MNTFRVALASLALALAASSAQAAGPYTIYTERQRGSTVTLEHNPLPPILASSRVQTRRVVRTRVVARSRAGVRRSVVRRTHVRRVHRYTGIAGGCREGGLVHRVVAGRPVTLQREVCHNINIRLTGPYVVR